MRFPPPPGAQSHTPTTVLKVQSKLHRAVSCLQVAVHSPYADRRQHVEAEVVYKSVRIDLVLLEVMIHHGWMRHA